jgi:hypothetical protein
LFDACAARRRGRLLPSVAHAASAKKGIVETAGLSSWRGGESQARTGRSCKFRVRRLLSFSLENNVIASTAILCAMSISIEAIHRAENILARPAARRRC